jgi:hypothetical protein
MINYTSHWVVDVPLIVVSYFAWRKYKTKNYLHLSIIFGAVLLLGIWVYLVDRVFHLSPGLTLASNIITLVLFALLLGLVLKVAFFPPKE